MTHRGAGDRELGDTIEAYSPIERQQGRARHRKAALQIALMAIAAFLIIGTIARLLSSTPVQIASDGATAPASPVIRPMDVKDACAGQTWPYFSSECLGSKAR
jgi:hypothetical protein